MNEPVESHPPNAVAPDQRARVALRRGVYALLIALSLGSVAGRILAVNTVNRVDLEKHLHNQGREDWRRQTPFLSANDRSRWCMIRALVEHQTYAIDEIIAEPNWHTIDMVQHKDRQGQTRLYSSKPPLLPTLLAGPYWVIHRLTGATLASEPYLIGRGMLLVVNGLCLLIIWLVLARLVERHGSGDWGRIFVLGCATLGTYLTTFAVTLNNHVIGAAAAMMAVDAAIRIWYEQRDQWRWYALAGLAAAFTAANELPALSLLGVVGAVLAWRSLRLTLLGFLPGAALVAAGFFGTNYLAHDTLAPPYAFRSSTDPSQNWYEYTYERNGRTVTSYWTNPGGVDRGEPDPGRYVVHALVGHHGVFSLTPIWLLSFAAMVWALWGKEMPLRGFALLTLLLSVVCLTFYLTQPQSNRNYGGVTSGFRWMFWFAPPWLLAMLPLAERMARRRWLLAIALLLAAFSAMSASYPTWNPWTSPWISDYFESGRWIHL
jgi:hypothetical protein